MSNSKPGFFKIARSRLVLMPSDKINPIGFPTAIAELKHQRAVMYLARSLASTTASVPGAREYYIAFYCISPLLDVRGSR